MMERTKKSKSWKVIYNAPRELQPRERMKMVSSAEELATVPATKVVAVPGQTISLADGESADVPAITVGFSIPGPVVDETGGIWRCVGWYVEETDEDGLGSGAGIKVSEDLTLVWVWELEVTEDDPGREEKTDEELAPVAPEEKDLLTIYANDDGTLTVEANVANGYAGYWYSLYAADELDGEWDIVDNVQTEIERIKGEQEEARQRAVEQAMEEQAMVARLQAQSQQPGTDGQTTP